MPLAEEDEVIQALILDGLHESLGVWIAVRTLRRDLHAPDAFRLQNFWGQLLHRDHQPTSLIGGERDPSAASGRPDGLLQQPDLLLRGVQKCVAPTSEDFKEFVEHYMTERFRQGIGGQLIRNVGPTNDNGADGKDACRLRLGGLPNYYHREAA
jgi:hypothetical protein